jgi:hypothetical protein
MSAHTTLAAGALSCAVLGRVISVAATVGEGVAVVVGVGVTLADGGAVVALDAGGGALHAVSSTSSAAATAIRGIWIMRRALYFFLALVFAVFARVALPFSIRSRSASACCTVLNFESSPRRSLWTRSRNAGSVD